MLFRTDPSTDGLGRCVTGSTPSWMLVVTCSGWDEGGGAKAGPGRVGWWMAKGIRRCLRVPPRPLSNRLSTCSVPISHLPHAQGPKGQNNPPPSTRPSRAPRLAHAVPVEGGRLAQQVDKFDDDAVADLALDGGAGKFAVDKDYGALIAWEGGGGGGGGVVGTGRGGTQESVQQTGAGHPGERWNRGGTRGRAVASGPRRAGERSNRGGAGGRAVDLGGVRE